MNMHSRLKKGDLLYRNKGVVSHVGVCVADGRVAHIRPGGAAEIVSLAEYAEGKPVEVKHSNACSPAVFESRLRHILRMETRYSLLDNNCEHLASFLTTGRKASPQLQLAVTLGVAGGLLAGARSPERALLGAGVGAATALILSNLARDGDFTVIA